MLVLFSMAEVALRQMSRALVQLESAEEGNAPRSFLLRHEKQTLLTTQLGMTLGALLLGIGVYESLLHFMESLGLMSVLAVIGAGIAVLLTLWLLLIGSGAIAAMVSAGALYRAISMPMAFFFFLFFPVTMLLVPVLGPFSQKEPENEIEALNHSLALQPFGTRLQPTPAEAAAALLSSPEVDSKLFQNALTFKNVKVRECMVPRTEIDAIELEEGVEALREAFIETGHSKILIYQDSLDHILGYCHQFALFKQPSSIEEILTPMEAVPEGMMAQELFVKFITEHRSIVLVVDEFGGTSGIVTLEDVMEEIIGDINDEYDEEDLLEQPLAEPGSYLFSARQEVDYLNDKYNLQLPEGDYETLGGFILSVLEEIPSTGDVVVVPPFEIRILSMADHRINTVHLSVRSTPEEE